MVPAGLRDVIIPALEFENHALMVIVRAHTCTCGQRPALQTQSQLKIDGNLN